MPGRPAGPDDHDAIARICLLTGATGGDATGLHGDDSLLADVYATPYLHGPGGFCLVEDDRGRVVGYVLGTEDTVAFQEWFVRTWWPSVRDRHPAANDAGAALVRAAEDPARMLGPAVASYPAHVHIDLLAEAQGRGAGRALIDAMLAHLAARGVTGVHLVAERANVGAQAFYERVGFERVHEDEGAVTWARSVPSGPADH